MEAAGYKIQCFRVPASGVGAPHIRERAVIIAHSGSESVKQTGAAAVEIRRGGDARSADKCGIKPDYITDTVRVRLETCNSSTGGLEKTFSGHSGICRDTFRKSADSNMSGREDTEKITVRASGRQPEGLRTWCRDWDACKLPDWKENPSCICRMDDGFSASMDKHRLQALGNAVVPRVFYPFFRAIRAIEEGDIK